MVGFASIAECFPHVGLPRVSENDRENEEKEEKMGGTKLGIKEIGIGISKKSSIRQDVSALFECW
jgi:hypothetical protein